MSNTKMTHVLDSLKKKPLTKKTTHFSYEIGNDKNPTPSVVKLNDKTELNLLKRDDLLTRIKNFKGVLTQTAPMQMQMQIQPSAMVASTIADPLVNIKFKKIKKIKLVPVSELKQVLHKPPAPNESENENKGTKKRNTQKRLPLKELTVTPAVSKKTKPIDPVLASEYYLNNREKFIEFTNKLFQVKYRAEIVDESRTVSCDDRRSVEEFGLLTHQKIVKDYLNMFSPYRGLLLFHGLGSGKTCSSIAIAEGLKSEKRVFVMTPAFLRANYLKELKKCGDDIYKKPRHWRFVDATDDNMISSLAEMLSISPNYVKKNKGAWLVDPDKPTNYGDFNPIDQAAIDMQLNEMIQAKYTFISYNGIRESRLNELSMGYTINPFDNSVVVIDEAHNFVSRIVNHIKKTDESVKKSNKTGLKPEEAPIALNLYRLLLDAVGTKIVLLTGTPIINYPNEIGVLFNILRGYIRTWTFQLNSSKTINESRLKSLFHSLRIMDYMKYNASDATLTITRNPFGFVNVNKTGSVPGIVDHEGVVFSPDENGNMNDEDFVKLVVAVLASDGIKATKTRTSPVNHKALPDTIDGFEKYFIDHDTSELKNIDAFKRRILGLTSYYRSAQEQLLPKYDVEKDFNIVRIPMSNYQLNMYQQERLSEMKKDRDSKKRKTFVQRKPKKPLSMKDLYAEPSSSYRIFSRSSCNYVFPRGIERPKPNIPVTANNDDMDEINIDTENTRALSKNPEGDIGVEESTEIQIKVNSENFVNYETRIKQVLEYMKTNQTEYFNPEALSIYSPKFLTILQNLFDESNVGLHLIYSQFRTLEGIGLLKIAMETNGYTEFRIKRDSSTQQWTVDMNPDDAGKRRFALYTGTESAEEKEIIRYIFNSEWDQVPSTIREDLLKISGNNFYGEVINTLMISASGAEGIDLRNVRHVHILEPYWHPVRIEQVIGRARRICSHQDLPEIHRTVKVFLYLMIYSPSQLVPLTKAEKVEAEKEEALLASTDPKIMVDVSNSALKYVRVSRELREGDISSLTNQPITTDESLYEIAKRKQDINNNILKSVKETAIDCAVHTKFGTKETLKCFTFDNPENKFSYPPNLDDNIKANETVTKKTIASEPELNKEMRNLQIKEFTHAGVKYGLDINTNKVYDYENLKMGNLILIGKLVEVSGKNKIVMD